MKCSLCRRDVMFRTASNPRLRADKEHDLCQRCFRDQRNRVAARLTRPQAVAPPPRCDVEGCGNHRKVTKPMCGACWDLLDEATKDVARGGAADVLRQVKALIPSLRARGAQ